MMTRYENLLLEMLLKEAGELAGGELVRHLFALGLISRRACEQRAICEEIHRLEAGGMPRCEAFEAAADTFCCSYEKARNAFYKNIKN